MRPEYRPDPIIGWGKQMNLKNQFYILVGKLAIKKIKGKLKFSVLMAMVIKKTKRIFMPKEQKKAEDIKINPRQRLKRWTADPPAAPAPVVKKPVVRKKVASSKKLTIDKTGITSTDKRRSKRWKAGEQP